MAFYSEAIGHAAMTGIAIGIILGENYSTPYFSTFGYSILFGILIIYTKTKTDIASDTLIGIFLAVSISIGASLLTYTAGTINPHIIENILFGSILTIEKVDIYTKTKTDIASDTLIGIFSISTITCIFSTYSTSKI
jgi:zinc transport system permease protein